MSSTLLFMEPQVTDQLWLRVAKRECIAYGDHGQEVEVAEDGKEYCVNCQCQV